MYDSSFNGGHNDICISSVGHFLHISNQTPQQKFDVVLA